MTTSSLGDRPVRQGAHRVVGELEAHAGRAGLGIGRGRADVLEEFFGKIKDSTDLTRWPRSTTPRSRQC